MTAGLRASPPAADEPISDVPMGALQLSATSAASATEPTAHDDPFGLHLEGSAAHRTAARGVEGSGGALPHLDTIQASFGKHDMSGVSAHVGGAASQAAGALGAEAYATGNSVAFADAPSLHTVAHEAAHVVQQRAGVSLKGGVGESGDAYEQHADAVADTVVAGRSAEALLEQGPGGGATSAGPAIQRKGGSEAAQPAPLNNEVYDPATDDDVQAAEGDTEGDKLRKAVLAAARTRLDQQTEIVSTTAIADKRAGNVTLKLTPDGSVSLKLPLDTPMKNFTTCIEFAGQTYRDGSKAAGADPTEQASLGRGLGTFMLLFNKETELQLKLEGLQKAINQLQSPDGEVPDDPKKQKPMDKAQAQKATHEAKKTELEAQAPTGDKAKDAATKAQIGAQAQAIKSIDSAIAGVQKHIDKFNKDMEAAANDKEKMKGINDAYMKADEQIPAGNRPKLGEYILTGAAGSQPYGVNEGTKVTLVKGMFKHIAVYDGPGDGKDMPAEGKWEQWKTIDGGGIKPVGTAIYVQVEAPYSVQFRAPDPDKPWASTSCLLGWVDADKLAALGKSDEAAQAAGLKKK